MSFLRRAVCTACFVGLVGGSVVAAQEAPVPQPVPMPQSAPVPPTSVPQPNPVPQPQPLPAPARNDQVVRTSYRLGPDDQIMIQIADVPDISGKPQRIDPNGDLKLPMVGRVRAAGLTIEQLEAELITRFKVYVKEPDVAVSVTEFHSQPVSVIGAVGTSGVRQLEGRKTLIEVLSLAGGLADDAGPIVRITRRADEGPIPVDGARPDPTGQFSMAEIELNPLLEATAPEKNIIVRPHDVISVPKAEMVFVIGEVTRPGPLPLRGDSVSVMEAVSASGGVLRTAASSNARILRRGKDGQKRTELAINLKRIMQGKSDDMPLSSGDILIVPGSGGKRAVSRVLEAAIQAGVIIGTYGAIGR